METEKITLERYLRVVFSIFGVALATGLLISPNKWLNMILIGGSILLIEHFYSWEHFGAKDIFGHEWLGLFMMLIPIFVLNEYLALILLLFSILLVIDFKVPFKFEIPILINNLRKK